MEYSRPELPVRSLTMFFPCHDEEGNVEAVTRAAVAVGRSITDDLEVIVVDDGSTDRTGEIAARLAQELPEVRVVTHERNRGYGAALRSGYGTATKSWIFYTDGDGQFDLEELPRVLAGMGAHDVFSGVRADRQDSLLRKVNAAVWNLFVRLCFGLRVRDVDCAFKVLPGPFVRAIDIRSDGAMIDTEVLVKAQRMGLSIQQGPVRHLPRTSGSSCATKLSFITTALREALELRRRLRREGVLGGGGVEQEAG